MKTNDRITRPFPPRTTPIRSVSALFGSGGADRAESPSAGSSPGPGEAWNEVVARSVELGYRVIDDYVRQGERMARAMSDRGASPQDMLGGDPQELARRMTQYAMDFTGLWFQMIQSASAGFPAGAAGPFANFGFPPAPLWPTAPPAREPAQAAQDAPAAASPTTTPVQMLRARVAIDSTLPVEVSLDLRPEAGARPMSLQSLRAADAAKPRLSDVSISRAGADEPYVLRVRVPAGQPAGVYNGLIVEEESGLPVGTVSLKVPSE